MPQLKPETIVPTPEEDEAISSGIAADSDTYELTAADLERMRMVCRPTRMDDAQRQWLKGHRS